MLVVLKNKTEKDITVDFPAGLIIKCLSGNYQNEVLLKTAKAKIAANKSYQILLLSYCGNALESSSSSSEKYEWKVVTN